MQFVDRLPHWIISLFRIALLGEIYPDIRAIAVGYSDDGDLLVRYYLDREPTEFDRESVEIVAINFDALGGKEQPIGKIDVQCIYSLEPKSRLDPLSGFLYSRREDFS